MVWVLGILVFYSIQASASELAGDASAMKSCGEALNKVFKARKESQDNQQDDQYNQIDTKDVGKSIATDQMAADFIKQYPHFFSSSRNKKASPLEAKAYSILFDILTNRSFSWQEPKGDSFHVHPVLFKRLCGGAFHDDEKNKVDFYSVLSAAKTKDHVPCILLSDLSEPTPYLVQLVEDDISQAIFNKKIPLPEDRWFRRNLKTLLERATGYAPGSPEEIEQARKFMLNMKKLGYCGYCVREALQLLKKSGFFNIKQKALSPTIKHEIKPQTNQESFSAPKKIENKTDANQIEHRYKWKPFKKRPFWV